MPMVVVPVESVHHLEHPDKPRCYVFRVIKDSDEVHIQRWETDVCRGETRHRCVQRYTLSREDARKRWAYLRKFGYVEFGYMSNGKA